MVYTLGQISSGSLGSLACLACLHRVAVGHCGLLPIFHTGDSQVDADPRIIVEGHEDSLDEVAAHPEQSYTFATACVSGKVRFERTRE